MDENKDIYIICLGALGTITGLNSGILRIKADETEFDKYFTLVINKLTNLANNGYDKVVKEQLSEKLNISIHTVISHRKNIIEKTGIKSLPGLTVFAISHKITSINSIPQ